jgi:hypothetical protein
MLLWNCLNNFEMHLINTVCVFRVKKSI